MKKIIFVFAALIVLISSWVVAEMPKVKEIGIELDQKVPPLVVLDTLGQARNIESLSGEKGLILVFYRSADWCPYCKKHLIEINSWHAKLTELGYKVAGVSYDSIETLTRFSEAENIGFPLLSDQNFQTIKSYGVLNSMYQPGHRHFGIPYPGIMIIDKDGKLSYKYFYQGYKKRIRPDKLFSELKG